jgi:hypothetical protein
MDGWINEWMITYWQAKIGSCQRPFHGDYPFVCSADHVQQTGVYVVYVTYVCIMSQGVYKVLLVLVVSDTLLASGQAKWLGTY